MHRSGRADHMWYCRFFFLCTMVHDTLGWRLTVPTVQQVDLSVQFSLDRPLQGRLRLTSR